MTAPDLFPDTLPKTYTDDAEARALAWGIVCDWFGVLRYQHSERAHAEIMESIGWPGLRHFVQDASLHVQDERVDFDAFVARVRALADRARREGLVVADGKPRKRGLGADAGDLFGGEDT